MARDILEQLSDEALIAVSITGRQWPSGLLSRTMIPDKWLGLVETVDGRRRFVPAGEAPRADDEDRITLVRNRPIVVPIAVGECRCGDGDIVEAHCSILIRWPAEEHELAALRKALLHSGQLDANELTRQVTNGGAAQGVRDFIASQSAKVLVAQDQTHPLTEALRRAMQKFCFETGARLDRVTDISFGSKTYEKRAKLERQTERRLAEIRAREMVEQAAAQATQRRLGELGGVLDKLNEAAAGDAEGNWHDLLPALSPTERGELLANLWRISPDECATRQIAVVAGQAVHLRDPGDPLHPGRTIDLPRDLGGLRSVEYAPQQNCLLVGAAEGLWVVNLEGMANPTPYPVPNVEPQRTGFNAIAEVGDAYYATHSKLGCWCWPSDKPDAGEQVFTPTDGTRTVRAAIAAGDGRVLFSADSVLHAYDPESGKVSKLATVAGTIAAISVLDGVAYVGTSDGLLSQLELEDGAVPQMLQQLHGGVESIVARRWNDLVELVVPAGREGVQGIYGSERITAAIMESSTAIRRAWAADDVVVGLSDHRDKLIISYPAKSPVPQEIPLARQLGHSLQDACLVV